MLPHLFLCLLVPVALGNPLHPTHDEKYRAEAKKFACTKRCVRPDEPSQWPGHDCSEQASGVTAFSPLSESKRWSYTTVVYFEPNCDGRLTFAVKTEGINVVLTEGEIVERNVTSSQQFMDCMRACGTLPAECTEGKTYSAQLEVHDAKFREEKMTFFGCDGAQNLTLFTVAQGTPVTYRYGSRPDEEWFLNLTLGPAVQTIKLNVTTPVS